MTSHLLRLLTKLVLFLLGDLRLCELLLESLHGLDRLSVCLVVLVELGTQFGKILLGFLKTFLCLFDRLVLSQEPLGKVCLAPSSNVLVGEVGQLRIHLGVSVGTCVCLTNDLLPHSVQSRLFVFGPLVKLPLLRE